MQYEKLTCSRELAEKMAQLGICQDEPELYWHRAFGVECGFGWKVFEKTDSYNHSIQGFIAPTLPRMMAELPFYCDIFPFGEDSLSKTKDMWCVKAATREPSHFWEVTAEDKHLPNAVAKALISIKEGENGS